MNKYEGIFILKVSLDNDAQQKLVEEIKEIITKNKGEIEQVQSWGKRKLAYPIKKQSEGIYYLIDFKLLPEMVKKIESVLKLNELILRVMTIKKES
ncbi:MAG: 30S ribosomal protein S6 [Candidatus Omnitrophica bacterium]|nr:30S ribosomal protein S6 [Candidatus Omnitrophota bacterium]MCG2702830.1 30S ribosomal protein S6 [Candidatus Omnitrophota bacterium]